MFLLYSTEGPPQLGSAGYADALAAYTASTAAMARAGVLCDCAPLQPLAATATVRVRDGRVVVTDGSETTEEQPSGFTLVECADFDEALRWAATIPCALDARVEVRPVLQVGVPV